MMFRMASLGDLPACSMASTCSVIGSSTPNSRASAKRAPAVLTPSATIFMLLQDLDERAALAQLTANVAVATQGTGAGQDKIA